jgi:hypothetical protein
MEAEVPNVSTTAGVIVDYVVSANNAFDPLGTLGSAQMMYYDQYALMYQRYRVLASKVIARVTQTTGASTAENSGSLYVSCGETASSYTTLVQLSQVGVKKSQWTQSKPATVSNQSTTQKISGQPNFADYAQAVTTTAPSDQSYWHIGIYPHTTASNSMTCSITLEFQIEFFERRPQADALETIKRLLVLKKSWREYLALKAEGKLPWQVKQKEEEKREREFDWAAEMKLLCQEKVVVERPPDSFSSFSGANEVGISTKSPSEAKTASLPAELEVEPDWEVLSRQIANSLMSISKEKGPLKLNTPHGSLVTRLV